MDKQKRRQHTLQEKWKREGEQLYKANKAYYDSGQAKIDIDNFIKKVKKRAHNCK